MVFVLTQKRARFEFEPRHIHAAARLRKINGNVFAKFAASDVITTDFDNASVMIYTIPAGWTINKKSCTPSWKLSAGDAATIRKLYAYADA